MGKKTGLFTSTIQEETTISEYTTAIKKKEEENKMILQELSFKNKELENARREVLTLTGKCEEYIIKHDDDVARIENLQDVLGMSPNRRITTGRETEGYGKDYENT